MDTTKEVLQVDVGTDEKTWRNRTAQWEQRNRDRTVQWEQRIRNRTVQWEQRTRDRAVQWKQRALEVMSRGILPYVAEGDIIMERSPTDI